MDTRKTILTEVDGWTPVINAVVKDLGPISALVFGRVWRYCQMRDGVCWASHDSIGKEIGLTSRTIRKHVKRLCKNGYLKDLTPGAKGTTHRYQDTGKASMKLTMAATVQEDLGKENPIPEEKAEVRKKLPNSSESVSQLPRKAFPTKKEGKREQDTVQLSFAPEALTKGIPDGTPGKDDSTMDKIWGVIEERTQRWDKFKRDPSLNDIAWGLFSLANEDCEVMALGIDRSNDWLEGNGTGPRSLKTFRTGIAQVAKEREAVAQESALIDMDEGEVIDG